MAVPQFLIALDQLVNSLIQLEDDPGWADETLSSRAYRMAPVSRGWARMRRLIDWLIFWEKDHCRLAFEIEVERQQSPPQQRTCRI